MTWYGEIIKPLYDDIAHKPSVVIGNHLENVTKTILGPLSIFAITANYADRMRDFCERIGQKIPQENLLKEASPQISGPCLDALKYHANNEPLTEMFLNLLAASIDKERSRYAHPAFPLILSHLSHDEAYILYRLSIIHSSNEDENEENKHTEKFITENPDHIQSYCPAIFSPHLFYPENYHIYCKHLEALGLSYSSVSTGFAREQEQNKQIQCLKYAHVISIELSIFGRMFASACVSSNIKELFDEIKKHL